MKKRLIDADELKRRFNKEYGAELGWYDLMRTYNLIDEMPSEEPERREYLTAVLMFLGALAITVLLFMSGVIH